LGSVYICVMQKSHINSIAKGLATCFVYEAFKKIEEETNVCFISVFSAFEHLGRVKVVLGEHFEKVKSELYEKAKWELLANGYNEDSLEIAAKVGIEIGELRPLPPKIGVNSYTFFADIVMEKIGYKIRYRKGLCKRWEVWNGRCWEKLPIEIRITGLVYEVMRQKIAIWREALEVNAANTDLDEWLKKLENSIKNPWWLEKVAEQLLSMGYFRGIVIT